jgi:hypothetical protein
MFALKLQADVIAETALAEGYRRRSPRGRAAGAKPAFDAHRSLPTKSPQKVG